MPDGVARKDKVVTLDLLRDLGCQQDGVIGKGKERYQVTSDL